MNADDSSWPPQSRSRRFEVELSTMRRPEADDAEGDTDANAPLIASAENIDVHRTTSSSASVSTSTGNVFVWALTISAGISGLLFGYDTGVISSTLVSIGTDLSSRNLTTLDKGLITSCTSAFALIASPIAGVFADRVGRKNIILVADALFTCGALWQAFSTSVWGMILGRSIVGFAIGGASLIVPLYISELAPSHLRGRLVTVSLLFITGGQVVAYVIGWAFSTVSGGWRWMVGLGAVPALVQLVLLFFMPDTPRFLCKVQRQQEAKAVLDRVYRGSMTNQAETAQVVSDIIQAINREILEEQEARMQVKHKNTSTGSRSSIALPPTLRSLLLHPPHVRALTITCSLQGLQQLCGFNSIMYFAATIFSLLDFSSPTLTSLSIACTNFLFTIAAFYLIDRIGRRRILLLTVPAMVAALLLCAASFTFVHLTTTPKRADVRQTTSPNQPQSRLPAFAILFSLVLYVAPYATGLGVVPWQQSELFPLSVRSLGSSIATATNWGCNTVVGLTFLPMMEFLGASWTFVCYAAVCAVGWVVVWRIYPETMGLGLEEVGLLLEHGWGVQKSSRSSEIEREVGRRRVTADRAAEIERDREGIDGDEDGDDEG